VPAILARPLDRGPWEELAADAAVRPAADLAASAQTLGVPAAALASAPPVPAVLTRIGAAGTAPRLVLDLSAMWAGPLCARILGQAGWRVLKVEDARRPDGARSGPAAFYADLHAGSPAVRLDFGSAAGRAELARLAAQAGVVLESSRPRALRRLGLVAEDWLAAAPGRVWVGLTGYGRADPQQRVAFGDDAAVAGGLVARTADGTPVFCGDAIADPLSGLFAALAALAALADGGGWLADVAMAGVCADLARPSPAPPHRHVISPPAARPPGPADTGWTVHHDTASAPVSVP
jgi:crotonobetainyl-CoA:carnitine CoA-transferase CaiB-like acyl-CoA transferase